MHKLDKPRYWYLGILFGVLTLLAGCAPQPKYELSNVSGHLPDLQFNLTNDLGQPVTAANYRGKIVMLYFGYTHCPDVCPLTMADMHKVMQTLGADAKDVQLLFVTVDPARDSPAILRQYLAAFDPRFMGLTGSQNQIAVLAKRYRAFFTYEKPNQSGNYEVTHSSGIYIFNRDGRAVLLGDSSDPQAKFVHDLKLLEAQKT